jgi:hypothetical protein
MALNPATLEPRELVAGDSISFRRVLADYPAGDGWALEYELSGPVNFEFTSAADGNAHLCTVAAATTAEWIPGEYLLCGFAVNASAAERVEIYRAQFVVTPNVAAGQAAAQTHAQKMILLIEAVQLGKAGHDILESDIEGSRIKRLTPRELREEYAYWKGVRENELAAEAVRNGRANRNKIKPVFRVKSYGVPIQFS